jgi:hypothetical protein
MKVPLSYPKIPDGTDCPLKKCVAFEKLDGTNIHWVYEQGKWTHFGTRRHRYSFAEIELFEQEHPLLKRIEYLFIDQIAPGPIFLEKNNITNAILFTEAWSPDSFAGHHPSGIKFLTPIDLEVDGKMLPPDMFINIFKNFSIPKVVYQGKYNGQFVEDVRQGKFKVNEGVVVKGVVDNQVYMTKIKTNAYMEKLKNKFQDQWKDYWE